MIGRIGIGEADVLPGSDCVVRVFSHDLDVRIHLFFSGAIYGLGSMV